MSKPYRRFELLLPLNFNDGKSVPAELLVETMLELENQFGAVSSETQIIQGHWRYQGETYKDKLTRVFVDVSDTPANRQFFVAFKERLKARFQQLDIWMATFPVEVL